MAEAFVSLATNDDYAKGALVLGHSLRENRTTKKLVLMITDGVSQDKREQLSRVWDGLEVVRPMDSGERENLILLQRPELGVTFTKLQAWQLTDFSKCVFLDADTLVVDNVDELFEREEFSAAPDIGWPDCFNSGVFVFAPSLDTYARLIEFAATHGSFDGGDQGLLNSFFSDWATKDIRRHLPFVYNLTPNATYGYAPAFKKFGVGVKVVHFIGSVKPWHHQLTSTGLVFLKPGTYGSQASAVDYIQLWWDYFVRYTEALSGTHGQTVQEYTDDLRRAAWDRGQPDYLASDRFERIQAKLDAGLQSTSSAEATDLPPKTKSSQEVQEKVEGQDSEEIQELKMTF